LQGGEKEMQPLHLLILHLFLFPSSYRAHTNPPSANTQKGQCGNLQKINLLVVQGLDCIRTDDGEDLEPSKTRPLAQRRTVGCILVTDCRLVLLPRKDRRRHTLAGRKSKVLFGSREIDGIVYRGCRGGVGMDAVSVGLGRDVSGEPNGLFLPGGVDLESCGVYVLGALARRRASAGSGFWSERGIKTECGCTCSSDGGHWGMNE
jgi:hypothetical protein